MKPAITILTLLALASCSPVHRIERVRTTEANNIVESYMETVWNPENNSPGERMEARKQIREYFRTHKHLNK